MKSTLNSPIPARALSSAAVSRCAPHAPDEVVKSKEPMWVYCGFRRWPARPIFSQNNLNSDKHKFERFLTGGAGNFPVASVYGPATFSPCPALLFRAKAQPLAAAEALAGPAAAAASVADMQLVGSGVVASADVDRIVLKRIILTGYPVRVHKRTAVIKHLFYRPQDVAWFKPAVLTTKHGLEGHITQSVGTHGLCKVHFGRAIMGHDTVCLALYKRVYPKFAVGETGDGNDDDGGAAATLWVV